ncbi:hypothetical protein FA13DRAFT_1734296 [Coprinellus micaceus]|uniref:Uncharacterized protein n=1 Tax=Coprinellus micaceus TaxID=71717 RepID=A0A4Y7T7H4_COPMI|nr:hypothetical protein FA13DRAFT_1734296 [Coprinellus micaceus]
MVNANQIPPIEGPPHQDEVQYLFAVPHQWGDQVGYERPDTDNSINWRFNDSFIECRKNAVG